MRWTSLLYPKVGVRGVMGVVALATLGFAEPCWADDGSRAAARKLATAGVEAFQKEDYAVAADKLERAYAMLRVPSIGLWLARSLAKQGKLVAAQERYTEVSRLPESSGDVAVQAAAKRDAAQELDALASQIPSIVVKVEGAAAADVKLSLDGKQLSSAVVGEEQPVDPGTHQVEGQVGEEVVRAEVTLAQAESKTAVLRFTAPPASAAASATTKALEAPPPAAPSDGSGRKIAGWSLVGAGAAGLVVGGVAGVLALSKKGTLDDSGQCVDGTCYRGAVGDDLDSYQTLRTVSSVGFIAGGVLAAAGAVVLFTTPSKTATAQRGVWVSVGASSVSAGGRF